jgi:hypothetical protein
MYSLVSISHGSRVLSYMGYSLDVKCFPNALVLKGLVLREAFLGGDKSFKRWGLVGGL